LAHLVGVHELLLGELGHDGATPRRDGHEPLGGESPERLADRSSAHSERGRKGDLVELRARLEAARQDLLAEMREHLLAQCEVAYRDRKSTRLNSSHRTISYA